MSFSFNVREPSKAAAKVKVAEELAKVVAGQPFHEKDQALIQATADAYIDLLGDDDTKDIYVSVNGSGYVIDDSIQQIGVNVLADLSPKLKQ